ncbi:MAG: alpha/beta hydrolase [Pseudomonadota bacterium]
MRGYKPIALAAALLSMLLLMGCAAPRTEPRSPDTFPSLAFNAAEVAQADHLVIAIPGALSSYTIFDPMLPLLDRDTTAIFYTLPGMDGTPLDRKVTLDGAAAEIAAFAASHPKARITLVGVSTGAAIAIETATRIGPRASVAAISTPAPGEAQRAGLRGLNNTLAIAARLGTLDRRKVWEAYYKVLLYGRGYAQAPQTAAKAETVLSENRKRITLPSLKLFRAHSADLNRWSLDNPETLAETDLVFFHGTVDPVFPPQPLQEFAARIPNAKVELVPGHGHLLFASDPNFFVRVGARMSAW